MSQLDENLTTEYLYSEPVVTVETKESRRSESGKSMYTFLTVFFFILALGGLFIGMLTSVWSAFQQPSLFMDYLGEDGKTSVFSQCMLGQMVNVISDLFGSKNISQLIYPALVDTSSKIWFIFNLFLIFATCFVAILALVLMIIVISSKSKALARNCAMTSGISLFLVYGGYFLLAYAIGGAVDAPSALIGGLVLVTLIITAIARRKAYGLLSSLLLVLTMIAIMMLNYSEANLTRDFSLHVFNIYNLDMFLGIALTLLVVVLAFNYFISTLRICPKKYFLFDAIRYGVQLFAVILTIIAYLVYCEDTWAIFSMEGQTLATVLLLVCSIATFVVALLETLLAGKKETTEQVIVDRQPVVYEPAYARVAPMDTYAPIIQPIVVAQAPIQPVYQPPVYQQPQPQPQPQPQAPAQPVETHVYVQQPERPDVPVTEFERRMQTIARGDSSVYDPSPVPVGNNQRVNVEQKTYEKQQRVNNNRQSNNSYVYEGSQYVYDPFIKTLTTQERNEFGDLFIANIYGLHSYLPTYVIGGDNKTFFDRVFIYLGCYRNYISQELLEKIYLYVSKL